MTGTARIDFVAQLRGEVNGQAIVVDGEGSIVQHLGVTSGTYFLRELPKSFDPKLLAACLVTGYPSACSDSPEHKNPFGDVEYNYLRELDLGSAGALTLLVDCTYQRGHLVSNFLLNGTARVTDLGGLHPIIETWERTSDREIRGTFSIAWSRPNAAALAAQASSKYTLAGPTKMPPHLRREIHVTPRLLDRGVFSLFQVSSLS
jgi:hypothetical protein